MAGVFSIVVGTLFLVQAEGVLPDLTHLFGVARLEDRPPAFRYFATPLRSGRRASGPPWHRPNRDDRTSLEGAA